MTKLLIGGMAFGFLVFAVGVGMLLTVAKLADQPYPFESEEEEL